MLYLTLMNILFLHLFCGWKLFSLVLLLNTLYCFTLLVNNILLILLIISKLLLINVQLLTYESQQFSVKLKG